MQFEANNEGRGEGTRHKSAFAKMLPDFDENGCLPVGIHRCDIEEMIQRFGVGSPEREVESRELLEFIRWSRLAVCVV
jgi:hypothetical protein